MKAEKEKRVGTMAKRGTLRIKRDGAKGRIANKEAQGYEEDRE